MKVVVLSGQTLTDVAIQVYGSAEGVFALATENGLEVTDVLRAGVILEYQPDKVLNKGVAQYYATRRVCSATAFTSSMTERVFDGSFDLTFN